MLANWLPVPHRRQREDSSDCLAACVAMILEHLEVSIDYEEILHLLDIQEYGAPIGNVRRLAGLGLNVIYGESNFDDLRRYVSEGHPCIAAVSTGWLSYWSESTDHAVVVVGVDANNVYLNDAFFVDAPKTVSHDEFISAWLDKDYRLGVIMR